MNDVPVNTTSYAEPDQMLSGLIGLYETFLPGRIRAYYLVGSYANGTAVPSSDVDLRILLRGEGHDQETAHLANAIAELSQRMTRFASSVAILSEQAFAAYEDVHASVQIKLASLLLYGDDLRQSIELPPLPTYTRVCVDTALVYFTQVPLVQMPILTLPRRRTGSLFVSLDSPDPDGEFYGYDLRRTPEGSAYQDLKDLVMSVRDMATAILVHDAGVYVGNKSDYPDLYRAHIGDRWSTLIHERNTVCKQQWKYQIPVDAAERQRLRDLCDQVYHFEHHFLSFLQHYLREQCRTGE